MRAPRENAIWMRDLRAGGQVQAEALTDLRGLLLRGLARSSRPAVIWIRRSWKMSSSSPGAYPGPPGAVPGTQPVPTWAMAIAVRLAMSALRRKRWQDVSLESMTEPIERALAWDRTTSRAQPNTLNSTPWSRPSDADR